MKICLLTRSHQALGPRLHHRLAHSLVSAGHQITIVCRVPRDASRLTEELDGVRYVGVPRPGTPRRDLKGTFQLFCQAWRVKAEAYICFEMRTLVMGLVFKLFNGAKVLYDCHEYRPEMYNRIFPAPLRDLAKRAIRNLERLMAQRADVVWAVNEHLAARFRPHCEPVIVLPNYPLLETFEEIKSPPEELQARYAGKKVLLYVGGISQARGVTASLRVMAHLRHDLPQARMLFIGRLEGSYAQEVKSLVSELELGGAVEFLGRVEYTEIPSYLRLGDLGIFLVQPVRERYNWGEPIKYFEYAAAGLPVVMSDLPAKRRLVEEVGNGIVVDPLNHAAAAEAIVELLGDKSRRQAMARRGREAFLSRLNWQAVAPQMLDSLRLLEGKNAE